MFFQRPAAPVHDCASRLGATNGAYLQQEKRMSKWPLGVFASIDAGLGVRLEIAQELGVPTIHLHTPQKSSRTPERMAAW